MPIEIDMDELMSIHWAAQRLKVDDTTVRRWIGKGQLEAVELPHGRGSRRRAYRVRRGTIEDIATPKVIERFP